MRKLLLVSFSLMIFIFHLAAQKFDAVLNVLATRHQPEKIYIHYDKEYYITGETIWFKAYLYNDGKPGVISNNLYLQLIDSKGHIISNKRFPISGATAKGSIAIPDSLPYGNYYIRALTPDMLNYDEAFIYKKNIFILKRGGAEIKKGLSQNVSIQFFPESGHLVDGVLAVVGFKATDEWGIPVEASGIIRLEDGTTIAPFKSYHDGIGKVQFKAEAGKKYVAETEFRTVTEIEKKIYFLPEVDTMGISLKIEDEKGGKKFQLSRSMKHRDKFNNIWLVAQINNHVVYESEITFENYPSVIGHLITDSLPSGILHFAVFNKDRILLAERLTFIDNQEYETKPILTVQKIETQKRAENSIELSFVDLIERSCSVSITDASVEGFADSDNILSRLLLTSDIKGYIWNPSWYFTKHTDTTKLAIDNLMITQSWSRFNWSKIMAKEFPVKQYSDQPLIAMTGKVTGDKNKEPLLNGVLNISLEGENATSQNYEVLVDAAGNFKLDSLLTFGKTRLLYDYIDSKGKAKPALLSIDENPLLQLIETIPQGMLANSMMRDTTLTTVPEGMNIRTENLQSGADEAKVLEKVTIQTKSNKKADEIVNEKYTTGVFKSEAKVSLDNITKPANDQSLNVVDYIKNRIPQVELQGNQFVNRKNFSLQSGQKWAIGIFLNEIPADVYQLRVMRTDDIALVKFFEAGFVGVGSSFPGGALAIYTKNKFSNEETTSESNYIEYNGYSVSRNFYNPNYNNLTIQHPVSDNRTTLYWNPDIYTNAGLKSVLLKYFNNDISKKFKVVVEGFDAMGKLVHLEKIIGN